MKRFAVISILALATTASAQELNLATASTERPHLLRFRTGLDHGFTAEFGYDHILKLDDRLLIVGAEIVTPWAQPDLGDLTLRVGATMPLVERGKWKLAARLAPTLHTSDTVLATMVSLGAEGQVTAGYHARRGFVAAELSADWAIATHISNSDAYKMNVYPDARDGWYSATGGTIRAGLQGGLSFSSFDVVLRVGHPVAIDLDKQMIPFYATVGVNVSR